MATTRTVFNWPVPEGTDFLKVGWSAIQNTVDAIAATITAVTTRPLASLRQNTAQTGLAAGAWASITMGAEDIDSANGHDLITNPARYTVPTGQSGTYQIDGEVAFAAAAAAGVNFQCRLVKNGAVIAAGSGSSQWSSATSQPMNAVLGSKIITLAAGEYIELQGMSSAAWATLVTATTNETCSWLTIERIR